MHSDRILRAVQTAAKRLEVAIASDPKFGWHSKSCGVQVTTKDGNRAWLRVLLAKPDEVSEKLWLGTKLANDIRGVKKPRLLLAEDWMDRELKARSELLTYVPDSVVSPSETITAEIIITDGWIADLCASLRALASHKTDRISIRQDLVTRRVKERFGENADATILFWETAHADLHWANLTQPDCWILDWESWGIAPKGTDAAFLYCFSQLAPRTAYLIHSAFSEVLESPDGLKIQMFACAELLRMMDIHGDTKELYPALWRYSETLASRMGYQLKTLKQ